MNHAAIFRKALRTYYPDDAARAEAESLLQTYGQESWHREADRVRVAILKLAGDSLEEVQHFLDVANQDFRDVLASAEYPEQMSHPPLNPGNRDEHAKWIAADLAQYKLWVDSLD